MQHDPIYITHQTWRELLGLEVKKEMQTIKPTLIKHPVTVGYLEVKHESRKKIVQHILQEHPQRAVHIL